MVLRCHVFVKCQGNIGAVLRSSPKRDMPFLRSYLVEFQFPTGMTCMIIKLSMWVLCNEFMNTSCYYKHDWWNICKHCVRIIVHVMTCTLILTRCLHILFAISVLIIDHANIHVA